VLVPEVDVGLGDDVGADVEGVVDAGTGEDVEDEEEDEDEEDEDEDEDGVVVVATTL
jgi:hypothetical protein